MNIPAITAPMQMNMLPNPYTHSCNIPMQISGQVNYPPQWQQQINGFRNFIILIKALLINFF